MSEDTREAKVDLFLHANQHDKDRLLYTEILEIKETCFKRCAMLEKKPKIHPTITTSAIATGIVGLLEGLKQFMAMLK